MSVEQKKHEEISTKEWKKLLSTAKLTDTSPSELQEFFVSVVEKECILHQSQKSLSRFVEYLLQLLSSSSEEDLGHSHKNLEQLESVVDKEEFLSCLLNVKYALRFLLKCIQLSNHQNQEEQRIKWIQNECILKCKLHLLLSEILSVPSSSLSTICYHESALKSFQVVCTLSAKLLCNLITGNTETSSIVSVQIPISPSDIKKNDSENRSVSSWVDMVSNNHDNRSALAAICASIYNILFALKSDFVRPSSAKSFVKLLVDDRLLVCNLLRQIISVQTYSDHIQQQNSNNKKKDDNMEDEATEWITRLLFEVSLLSSTDSSTFKNVYFSAASNQHLIVTPEQVVLLFSILHSLGECEHEYKIENKSQIHELLLCISNNKETIQFLIQQTHLNYSTLVRLSSSSSDASYEGELQCRISVYTCFLDILSSLLSINCLHTNSECIQSKQEQKKEHTKFMTFFHPFNKNDNMTSSIDMDLDKVCILSNCAHHLQFLLNKYIDPTSHDNTNNETAEKSSEHKKVVQVTDSDKVLLKSLVRFIGNVCYKSKIHQDILRLPISVLQNGTTAESSTSGQQQQQPKKTTITGLHSLLSCTSLSYAVFGLREWAIVAIRNALDQNTENQVLVHELEMQNVASESHPSIRELKEKFNINLQMGVQGISSTTSSNN